MRMSITNDKNDRNLYYYSEIHKSSAERATERAVSNEAVPNEALSAVLLVVQIFAGVVGVVIVGVLVYKCCVSRRHARHLGGVIAAPSPQAAPSPPSVSVMPRQVLGGAVHCPTVSQHYLQPRPLEYPPPYDHVAFNKEPMLIRIEK